MGAFVEVQMHADFQHQKKVIIAGKLTIFELDSFVNRILKNLDCAMIQEGSSVSATNNQSINQGKSRLIKFLKNFELASCGQDMTVAVDQLHVFLMTLFVY